MAEQFRVLSLLLLAGVASSGCAAGEGDAAEGGAAAGAGTMGGSSGAGGTGGADTGGAGGKAAGSGGTGGFAGQGLAGKGPLPETGCGARTWPAAREQAIFVGPLRREFTLALPGGYDENQPYPVVVSWHGLGGSMGNYYQLNSSSRAGDTAIHLSPQGLDTADGAGAGWWNDAGQDLAFVDALIAWVKRSFCVDETRLFSVGFSAGAMFSHLLACERGDVFRAIAPIAGSFGDYYDPAELPPCGRAVPLLGIHGIADDRVPVGDGERARDVWVARNGCGPETQPVEPAGCSLYQGCMAGYPVEWCTHEGTHLVPSFAADVIWQFFSSF